MAYTGRMDIDVDTEARALALILDEVREQAEREHAAGETVTLDEFAAEMSDDN